MLKTLSKIHTFVYGSFLFFYAFIRDMIWGIPGVFFHHWKEFKIYNKIVSLTCDYKDACDNPCEDMHKECACFKMACHIAKKEADMTKEEKKEMADEAKQVINKAIREHDEKNAN